ncbi:hypothetical protein [Nodularia chucula]|uniref:hypothetical protein n=1 Tax=Nodularia chucula TaxID=3093667 RepID=UPI0039C673F5
MKTKNAGWAISPPPALECHLYCASILALSPYQIQFCGTENIFSAKSIFKSGNDISDVILLKNMGTKLPPPQPTKLNAPCPTCGSSRGMTYFLDENYQGFVWCGHCDVALYPAEEVAV